MNLIANLLPLIQIALSVALVTFILLQRSDAGVGGAFGGQDGESGHFQRRGFERTLFRGTVLIAILFAISAFVALLV